MLKNGMIFAEEQNCQVNNSLFELQNEGQPSECRKVQIGDLSSIEKSLKEKAERKLKLNHVKNAKQKQLPGATKSLQNRVECLIYHAEQASTQDQALITCSQYNCDPINDPIYERKTFNGALKQSANAMPKLAKLGFSSSGQSKSTYFKFSEPSFPSSPVARQIQTKSNNDAEKDFERQSPYPLFIQQQTTPAQKKAVTDGQTGRKSILVNLKQLNMNFGQRPRSVSDPLVRRSKFLVANKRSPLVSRRAKVSAKPELKLKGEKEKSYDQREHPASFQGSSFPIKITSLTSSGEQITQEYIFGKKSETISGRIAPTANQGVSDEPKIEREIARDEKMKHRVSKNLLAVVLQSSEDLADGKACNGENLLKENLENLSDSQNSASSCSLQSSSGETNESQESNTDF